MKTNFLVFIVIYVLSCSIESTNSNKKVVFNIGSLLPETNINNNLKNDKTSSLTSNEENCKYDQMMFITNAIKFTTEKLSNLFEKFYGCNVNLSQADTHCDVSYGTRSFFELAKDIQKTLIVFSGSCDSTIKPIAESVQFFNLTMLSFTETDPTFSDQLKYNGFYRVVPGEEQHNNLRIHLIRKFNWTRIGTVYLTKAKYTLAHNLLIRELDRIVNVTVSRSILENQTSDQYETILNELKNEDIKIIIGLFDFTTTIKFFCEVYKHNMYGKNYQWIILGTYDKRFLYSDTFQLASDISCSREEILVALNGTLQTRVVEYAHEYKHRTPSISNKKKLEFENQNLDFEDYYEPIVDAYLSKISKEIKKMNSKTTTSPCFYSYFHGYAFDTILAIFKTLSLLIENKKFSCQSEMFERNIDWFSLLTNALNKVSFKGITGNVTFQNGSRIGQIKLEQLIVKTLEPQAEVEEVLIYVNDQNENRFFQKGEIRWHGKKPPTDQTIKIRILYRIPQSIFIGMSIFATSGILLALAFLIFNIKFREHKFIKMSSPYLNNLIIVGCLFSYSSIYFIGEYDGFILKSINNHICVIRLWLLTIGFTLAFGAMFSKTYRVHAILTNSRMTKKVIKDYKLFGIVVFLLVLDIILLVSWQVFDPLKIVRKQYDSQTNGENIVLIDNYVCESSYFKIWIASLFSYKSLLILFGCFFAYETRNVTIPALNDSKYIGISVYNVLIMCSAGAAIGFIVHNKNAAFILITLFIFFCTSITLCLVFLPKVFEVRQDPLGKKNQKPKTNFKKNPKKENLSKGNSTQDFEKKLHFLNDENRRKTNILEQLNTKIKTLIQTSIETNSQYLRECLDFLNVQDEQTQKLFIESLKMLNLKPLSNSNSSNLKSDQLGNSFKRANNNSVKSNNNLNTNNNHTNSTTTTTTTTNSQMPHSDDKPCISSECDEDDFSTTNNNSICFNSNANDNNNNFTKTNDEIESTNLASSTNTSNTNKYNLSSSSNVNNQNQTSPSVKLFKRKFNPPPQIIDLNGIIAEDLDTTSSDTNPTTATTLIHRNFIYNVDV